jgi:hypothetical protein
MAVHGDAQITRAIELGCHIGDSSDALFHGTPPVNGMIQATIPEKNGYRNGTRGLLGILRTAGQTVALDGRVAGEPSWLALRPAAATGGRPE